jgi:hypothetical protein
MVRQDQKDPRPKTGTFLTCKNWDGEESSSKRYWERMIFVLGKKSRDNGVKKCLKQKSVIASFKCCKELKMESKICPLNMLTR